MSGGSIGGVERRPLQAALAVLCLLALLAAAVATPGVPETDRESPGAGGTGGPGGGPGNGTPGTTGTVDGPSGEPRDGSGSSREVDWDFGSGSPDEDADYLVVVSPDPVPGRTVEVEVLKRRANVETAVPKRQTNSQMTDEFRPVRGAEVTFNDEPVGRTDATGTVSGRVPYDARLRVRVRLPSGTVTERGRRPAVEPPVGTEHRDEGRLAVGWGSGSGRRTDPARRAAARREEDGSVDDRNITAERWLPTTAAIDVRGDAVPGATVTIEADVDGVPVRNASVAVNGRRVGLTDDAGEHDLRVPRDRTERLRIRVERGEIAGETTVEVRLLTVDIRPDDPVALPGRPATVRARVGAENATGAAVRVGERRTTAGPAGRARTRLPTDPTTPVVVSHEGQTVTRSMLPLYAVGVGVTGVGVTAGLAVLGGVGALLAALVRHWRTIVGRAAALGRAVGGGMVAAGRLCLQAAAWAIGRIVGLGRWLASVAAAVVWWAVGIPGALWRLLRGGPRGAVRRARGALRWAVGIPGRVGAWLRGEHGAASSAATGSATNDDGSPTPGVGTLWRALAALLYPDRWRRRTPGEVARAAVERGLPRDAVADATDVFREAEYGPTTPAAERRRRARELLESFVDHVRERDRGDEE